MLQQSDFIKGSKKLWKLIGIEHNASSMENVSECSTVKIPEGKPALSMQVSADELRLFTSDPLDEQKEEQKKDSVNGKPNKKPVSYDLDILSCESEGDETPLELQSPQFRSLKTIKLKDHIKSVHSSMIQLKYQNQKLKRYVLLNIENFNSNLLNIFQQIMRRYQEKEFIFQKCQKCSGNKKVVDVLTKQCWDLEKEVKSMKDSQSKINQTLKFSQYNQPLKDVESGLLEERGQMVKRLKIQLDLMTQENGHLRKTISTLEEQLSNNQAIYKQNLLELRKEISEIEKAAEKRQKQLMERNNILEEQFQLLNQQNLLMIEERSRKQEADLHYSMKNVSNHDGNDDVNKYQRRIDRLVGNSSLKQLTRDEKRRSTSDRKKNFNTELYQNPSQESLASQSRARGSIASGHHHIQKIKVKQRPLVGSFKLKRSNYQQNRQMQKSRMTYNGALDSLAELKREVRREIKRSKYI